MKSIGRFLTVAAVAGALSVPALQAQSTSPQNQPQDQQAQPKPQANPNESGVSQPPPDDTIRTDEDMSTPPPPPPAASIATPEPEAKPSAAIPIKPAPAPAPVTHAAVPAPAPSSHPNFPSEVDNTDDGIVTVVPSHSADTSATLQQRDSSVPDANNADYGIVNAVPYNPNDLRTGTNISVRLKQNLSTTDTAAGTPFTATVRMDVYNENTLVIPAGSELRGRVLHVSQGHRFGPHASLRMHADTIVLPDGTAYHVDADVIESYAPGTTTSDEGSVVASNHYKKDAIQYGGSAGAGAAAGAVVAGPVGAGVGALVGAGLETTHLVLQDPSAANVPEGSVLIFTLNQPMRITPTKN
jgi:hypothetical protein